MAASCSIFDIAVTNTSGSTLRLTEIEMTVFDAAGAFVMRQTINSNGFSPGVEVISKPLLAPGETVDVFNPFCTFAGAVPVSSMRYVFRYLIENTGEQRENNRHRLLLDFDVSAEITVFPQIYETKTPLHYRCGAVSSSGKGTTSTLIIVVFPSMIRKCRRWASTRTPIAMPPIS
jgi:hypothetical protein